jgi:predicted DNA binding CopG/RHH family protein
MTLNRIKRDRINVRLSFSDLAILRLKAKQRKMDVSAYIRYLIERDVI